MYYLKRTQHRYIARLVLKESGDVIIESLKDYLFERFDRFKLQVNEKTAISLMRICLLKEFE